MSISLRARSIAIVLALVCGGFAIACPQWTNALAQQVWPSLGDDNELADNRERSRKLQLLAERVSKRIELKGHIISNLIAGRIELEEAADQFDALNRIEPEIASQVRISFEGADDRERTAKQVIGYTRIALQHDPSNQQLVVNRLELRLQVMKGQTPAEMAH